MNARYIQLGVLILGALCARAQSAGPSAPTAPGESVPGEAASPTNPVLLLSNQTVLIISQARGIEAGAVKLKFSDSMRGPFEIHPDGAKDLRREAELLSTSLGTNVAVIFDEATAEGRLRTNYVYRGGTARITVAPIVNHALAPGGRRLYVWPERSPIAPPSNVRLVRQAD